MKSPLSSQDVAVADVVIGNALAELGEEKETPAPAAIAPQPPAAVTGPAKFLVGVTSCATGIAHTFMAAEALKKSAGSGRPAESVKELKAARASTRSGPYKHLMTGVFVHTAAGLAVGGTAFQLYILVLAVFIAYSIADRPGLRKRDPLRRQDPLRVIPCLRAGSVVTGAVLSICTTTSRSRSGSSSLVVLG